jgi:sugar phosphate isomerase/epimerase
MKLGLLTAILPEYTFEEVVDYANSTGLDCIEVACWPKEKATRRYGGVTHIDLSKATDEMLIYYKEYALSKGIEISSLAYYPNPLSDNQIEAKKAIDHLYLLIEASAKMGINLVTTFIGKNKTKTVEENLILMEQVWLPILKYAASIDVRIAIENCPMLFGENEFPGGNNLASTPYVWKRMFNLAENIGLNFDPSHLLLLGIDIDRQLRDFRERIFHVHCKDMRVHQEKVNEYGLFSFPSLWHSPKLPGLGDVNFPSLISTLYDIGYNGHVCIEIEDRSFEDNDMLVRRGIEQSIHYLRGYISQ